MSAVVSQSRTLVVLLVAAVVAWAVTAERMEGMDAGPGTHLGGLGWYLGVWVTMMAAMMLPSAAPAAARIARLARGGTLRFAVGYLAVWAAFGLVAYALLRIATELEIGWLTWDEGGPYLAGGVLVAAGIYELTPLKRRFLHRCRAPAGRNGVDYGLDCVGSSAGLMAALFALGVMSLVWMAVVAAAIFIEKVLPRGVRLSRLVAVALLVLGLWVAVSPGSVPGLTEPDQAPAMHMEMKM
jgi:predicted metal-binding membrane protein